MTSQDGKMRDYYRAKVKQPTRFDNQSFSEFFTEEGDLLFIGFDLKKDQEIILNAYNDPHGHTAAFNFK